MAASRALITFAFVKDAFDNTGDIVQGLLPLFSPIFNSMAGKTFSPATFSKEVESFYGIRMHPWVAEDWTPRFEEAGFLIGSGDNHHRTYLCSSTSPKENVETSHAVVHIIEELIDHVERKLKHHKLELNRTEIEGQIFSRLQRVDFIALILKPNTVRASATTLTLPADRPAPPNDIEATIDFILASRIVELYDSNRPSFELISSISAGALVSEVVLGLRTPPSAGQKATGTQVFLDSPIIIDLLDLGDHRQHAYAKLLLDDLKSLGVALRTYEHNVDEIRNIISATLESYGDVAASVGTVAYRLRTDGNAVSRAQIIRANIHKKIREIGVSVLDMDITTKANAKYYPDDDLTDLVAQIRPFQDIFSREVDAKSIVGVGRQVLGRRAVSNVLSLPAIFLTKNSALARTANRILTTQRNYPDTAAPAFVTDRQMAGLLWLALGGGSGSLSQMQLIANCTVAVTPRKDVLGTVYKILSDADAESARHFELLMTEDRCAHYVMDYTLGDATIVTKDNAFEILEGVKNKAIEFATSSLTEAHSEELSALNASIAEKTEEIARREAQILALTAQAEERERAADAAQAAILDMQRLQIVGAVGVAKQSEISLKILIVLAVSVSVGGLAIASWYVLDALSGVSLAVALALVFFTTTFLTAILGWIVPDMIFGPLVSRRRKRRFEHEVSRIGAEDFVRDWDVNWTSGEVVRLPPQA